MVNKPAAPPDPASLGRIKQIRMAAGMVRKANPWALPIVGGLAYQAGRNIPWLSTFT